MLVYGKNILISILDCKSMLSYHGICLSFWLFSIKSMELYDILFTLHVSMQPNNPLLFIKEKKKKKDTKASWNLGIGDYSKNLV